MKKRKRFWESQEIQNKLTLSKISSKHSANSKQISKCKKEAFQNSPEASSNQAQLNHRSELKILYEQISKIQTENALLEKNVNCSPEDKKSLLELEPSPLEPK